MTVKTEKCREFLIHFLYFSVILLLTVGAVQYALPLVTPFIGAFILAYLLKRPILYLQRVKQFPWKLSAVIVVLLFFGLTGLFLGLLGFKMISAMVSLFGSLPILYEQHAQPFFMEALLNIEAFFMRMDPSVVEALNDLGTQLIQAVGELVSGLSVMVMGVARGIASSVPMLVVKLLLLIISTFFIAMDYEQLVGFCARQMSDRVKSLLLEIRQYVLGTLLVCLRSYLIIMSITFVELSIGLLIIGIEHAVLLAGIIAVFDILPVLGTGGIMIPWIILTFIQGDYPVAVGLLVLYLVVTIIRNIIEPKIVGSQLGLHPVVTLGAMFVGAQLFGGWGLFGVPIGLSLLCHLNEKGIVKVFR